MKYLTYYDINGNEGRNFSAAAKDKIDYIAKAISEVKEDVQLISASMCSTKGRFKAKEVNVTDKVKLKCFKAYKSSSFLQKIRYLIYFYFTMFFYLFFCVKKNETIIVYHSLGYMKIISLLKRIKKFKIILEVEEIYGDVLEDNRIVQKELKFFKKAEAYIFPTVLLNEKINKKNKPYVIIHGTYQATEKIANAREDGKIHCVYAGTLDPRKGGGRVACEVAEFLSEKYHVHILGFGTKEEEETLKKHIYEVKKKTKCGLTFEGLKSGEDYRRFIQGCHIGLSTQNPKAIFNNTSFPSKILSYMSNGLIVVSVRIKAIELSEVSKYIHYYDIQDPKEIARAIENINIYENIDSRQIINELDKKFRMEILNIVN